MRWVIPFVIVLATLSAFFPVLQNDFVNWDDEPLFLNNLEFRGLGWSHLRWMSATTLMGHWGPLAWMTLGLDYVVWGMNPFGYHLTNLLLHAAAVVAFYFVALRLLRTAMVATGETALMLGAGAAALFFAIHPLRVESVAWVTERRDVLSGLFFILTILTYLKATDDEPNRRLWLIASLGSYTLAILSKAIVITVPAVLILLDVYLGRIGRSRRGSHRLWQIWAEKIPYVALAMIAVWMAIVAQRTFASSMQAWPLVNRIAVAFYGLWFYVWKTVVPFPIWPLYEIYPERGPLYLLTTASALAIVALTTVLFLVRRKWPAGLAAWVCYAVLLAPVSGLTQSGPQLVASRYSYLACLPWALLIGAAIARVAEKAKKGTLTPAWLVPAGVVAIAVGFDGLGILTWRQSQLWHDSGTLWSYALSVDPTSPIAHNNLGTVLIGEGRLDEAETHIKKAVELRPGYQDAIRNLGVLALRGRLDDLARSDVGMKLVKQGDFDRAIDLFQKTVADRPEDATAQNNLGVAFYFKGDNRAAIERFERALEINPGFDEAKRNLEAAKAKQ